MLTYDIQRHNDEVARLLALAAQGTPERVLMTISANPRMILSDISLNPEGITFEAYMGDADVMLVVQARFQAYEATQIVYDRPMGFEGVAVYADMQNVLEASYFGCSPAYHGINEPGTTVLLNRDTRNAFLDKPFPAIDVGLSGRTLAFYETFLQRQKEGWTYQGKPVRSIRPTGMSTDGPFTVGCCLLGATELCLALYEDEPFAHAFLDYITDATIYRIKALRRHYGRPEKTPSFGFADDSIAMLSLGDYRRFILPLHQRLVRELSTGEEPGGVHLCGDAQRLMPEMRDALNVNAFDTGYPIRHGDLVRALGPDVAVSGGVHVDILRRGTPEAIAQETQRILAEVMPHTRKFTMKEANNLSPGTPPENVLAMYEATKAFGRYPG